MTSLSDFPPDVQAAAARHAWFDDLFMVNDRVGGVEAICRAIMADRAGRFDTKGLTSQQAACLKAIADHQARNGVSPSFDDLAAALGLAGKSGVHRLLTALEERGRIKRLPNRARAITIIATPAT